MTRGHSTRLGKEVFTSTLPDEELKAEVEKKMVGTKITRVPTRAAQPYLASQPANQPTTHLSPSSPLLTTPLHVATPETQADFPDVMPYFWQQEADYRSLKDRCAAQAASGETGAPEGVATIEIAIEALKVGRYQRWHPTSRFPRVSGRARVEAKVKSVHGIRWHSSIQHSPASAFSLQPPACSLQPPTYAPHPGTFTTTRLRST